MAIRVIMVDDHPLVLSGLQTALQNQQHIQVICTYSNGSDLLAGLVHEQPDVLLLDIQLPDTTGTELARIISKKYPSIHIIALTSLETPAMLKTMMQHGCKGYLLKSNTDHPTLIKAIETVYNGELFLSQVQKEQLLNSMLKTDKPAQMVPKLTYREKEILQFIAAELTNQDIADKLFISLRTVENHRHSLIQKLNAKNTAGLVRIAIEQGLIE